MPKALLFDLDGTLSNTDAVHFPNWIEVLQPLGLDGVFGPVVYPDDTGEGEDKPAPLPYERALKELGLAAEEVVAFEDSPTGARSAIEVGIPVVGISSAHAPEELTEVGVDLIIGDYKDPALYDFLGWD